jgi:hypothetical protein
MPQVDENSAQAQALGYRHDSNAVDAGKYPNHSPDQTCRKCALFTGNEGAQWGPCGIFPGKQVNADGWCSAFVRKA